MASNKNKTTLDVDYVRKQFPALKKDFIFMDNAGGSQTLKGVMNRITNYLTNYDVQLGASYKVSAQAGAVLDTVHQKLTKFINAKRLVMKLSSLILIMRLMFPAGQI